MRYKRIVTPLQGGLAAEESRRAAQYVRMSTDQQKYSIENQKQAILEYAAVRNINVVRTYADEGRSGVVMKGREGLQLLIADIQSGEVDFEVILVYDVSRWGRFQNTDESAYYEFLCKLAGVSIEYCAEPFENNDSVIATLIKSMKRAMAAEYSRDLSARITRAHRRVASMGFHQGGKANYGLRRLLVDEQGRPKFTLEDGQRKSLQRDRVLLVPGPEHEIAAIKEIFRLYVTEGASIRRIIRTLDASGICTARNKPWTIQNIQDILGCEKYVGTFVYNRTSEALNRRRVYHSPDKWLRVENAITPIVDCRLFAEAQCRLSETWKISNVDLLNYLTATWCATGYISGGTLMRNKAAPSFTCYRERFGCLRIAYGRIGFKASHLYRYDNISDDIRKIDRDVICRATSAIVKRGGCVVYDDKAELLRIAGAPSVRVVVVPYLDREKRGAGWRIYLKYISPCDLMLAVRLNKSNTRILDYYLLPFAQLVGPTFRFSPSSIKKIERLRLASLDILYARSKGRLFETA